MDLTRRAAGQKLIATEQLVRGLKIDECGSPNCSGMTSTAVVDAIEEDFIALRLVDGY